RDGCYRSRGILGDAWRDGPPLHSRAAAGDGGSHACARTKAMTVTEALRALYERWWVLAAAALAAALVAYAYVKMPWVEPRWRSSILMQATGRLDYGNFLALEKELRPLAEQVLQLDIMRKVDQNLPTDLPAAALLGLLVAGLVVLAVLYFDAAIRTAADVQRYLELPVFGSVPRTRKAGPARVASPTRAPEPETRSPNEMEVPTGAARTRR